MDIRMVFEAKEMSKEDITLLVQKIREWELTTKRTQIDYFEFTTDPPISTEETTELLGKVFPKFDNVLTIPLAPNGMLRLGTRAILIEGEIVGKVEEVVLNVEGASEEDVKKLTDAVEVIFRKIVETNNVYKGVRLSIGLEKELVTRNGEPLDPAPSQKVFAHSANGFSWGYRGSGPAQLALAILLAEGIMDEDAIKLHQFLKEDIVATWGETWVFTTKDLHDWMKGRILRKLGLEGQE